MNEAKKPIPLKELARLLDLSPATVSRIINGRAADHRIASETQKRVLQAAAQYGYTANALARSLREKRSYTIGIIVPEISEGYSTSVLSGAEDGFLKDGFFYLVVSHRHRADLLEKYPRMLLSRSVEGVILIDTHIEQPLPVPVVAVSGHARQKGIINIQLNHAKAAELGLSHLKQLGHTCIAFIKGQPFSSDTNRRWRAIVETARAMDIELDTRLTFQMLSPDAGPGGGHEATVQFLRTGLPFTAIFAFNDISAIGAIVALHEAGLRVPKDVSVLGFDDVLAASTNNPPLTTIQQPLREMGQAAATTLLGMIRDEIPRPWPTTITVQPHLVVRRSTSHASASRATAAYSRT
ncbi:MAG TPA: LacI family DNA-binding transcriptional regulator [Acidobacteriaceae bacterium]|nr:LacI family DNA-binding transcriptional regulator [Acidobacteriaceae bacterium]